MKAKKILVLILTATILMSFSPVIASAAEFSDVPESHPYKAAIDFCKDKGYVLGISDTIFMPDAKLTRAQLATIWCRSLSIKEGNHTFTDITPLKSYYDTSVIVLRSLGIFNGTSESTFSPGDLITREQLAALTMRTYGLKAANEEDYTQYADHASISEWARNSVSACINADVFEGLYDGENFKPQEAVTRGEICKLIYNISMPAYTVTIGPMTGGTVTASPMVARPGVLITLTVTPDTGKQLKAGTLKYNDTDITGTTFTMPAEDVLITAEFEDAPVQEPVSLTSIAITTEPAKTTYTVGETLDLSGLIVTASYSDDTTAPVTDYTTVPADDSPLDTAGTVTVTVSYTEDGITKDATFDVQVNAT